MKLCKKNSEQNVHVHTNRVMYMYKHITHNSYTVRFYLRTCCRRADEVGHAPRQHDDAVGVGEAVHAEQLHEDDGGERVVGADEEAVETGEHAQLLVAVQPRHGERHHAGQSKPRNQR